MHNENPPSGPEWVPLAGHCLRRTGVYFDAVRIHGVRGEEVTTRLIDKAGPEAAGPIVCEVTGFRWMYFLLPTGSAAERRWPPGVQHFGTPRTVAYIGIPALGGNTWPLRWYSVPSPAAPFVDPELLHETVRACPVPPFGTEGPSGQGQLSVT
ncbi:hypothetical protein ACFY12_23915 [Streptomyces sp. NPDC001339]|uniref:hypothetical protein n=1 Tax=Streptomyces sp. NPDC001339 TaxID=3364563 RepID=UPI0036AA5228